MDFIFVLFGFIFLLLMIDNAKNMISANRKSKEAITNLEEESEKLRPFKDRMDKLQMNMANYLRNDYTDQGIYAQEVSRLLEEYQKVRIIAIKQQESCMQAYYELREALHNHVRKQNTIGGGAQNASTYYKTEDRAHQAIQDMPTLSEDNMLLQKAMLYVERHRDKISGEMVTYNNLEKIPHIEDSYETRIKTNNNRKNKKSIKWKIILLVVILIISLISVAAIAIKLKIEKQPYISGSVSLNGLTLSIDQHQTRLIRIKYENEGSDWSLGWVDSTKVTIVTDKGTYYSHLVGSGSSLKIKAGKKGSKYVWMDKYDGTIESLTLETINLLDSSGLPINESKTSITINNTYGKKAMEVPVSENPKTSENTEDELQNSGDNIPVQSEVIKYIVNTSGTDLNVRKSPSPDGEIITKIKNSISCEGTGNITEDGWLEIYIPDTEQTGWVNEQYVLTDSNETTSEKNLSNNEYVDPIIQNAIDGYVPDSFNRFELFVGKSDKPGAAIWCSGGECKTYSSNENIASVDENGVVTGISPGEAYIVFDVNGMTDCYLYIIH